MSGHLCLLSVLVTVYVVVGQFDYGYDDEFFPPNEDCNLQQCFQFCEDNIVPTSTHYTTEFSTSWISETSTRTINETSTTTVNQTSTTWFTQTSVVTSTQTALPNVSQVCQHKSTVMKRDTGITQQPLSDEDEEEATTIRPTSTLDNNTVVNITSGPEIVPTTYTATNNNNQSHVKTSHQPFDVQSWNPFSLITKHPVITGAILVLLVVLLLVCPIFFAGLVCQKCCCREMSLAELGTELENQVLHLPPPSSE